MTNNDVFASLGERWYEADDDPVALLRAQAHLHAPWIARRLSSAFGTRRARVLDIGCGAGLIANELALEGYDVTGLDVAAPCLDVAARHDETRSVQWICADARSLPFPDQSMDAVCAMDFLEHVEPLDDFVSEFARVLAPHGRFFFHTFDRNPLSWLIVIKGVEWFVRNVPRDLHVLRMFVKPSELEASCAKNGLVVRELRGCAPRVSWAFVKMLATGIVPRDLEFHFTSQTFAGYTGFAERVVNV